MANLVRESAKCAYLWDGAAMCVSPMLSDIQTPKVECLLLLLLLFNSASASVALVRVVACYMYVCSFRSHCSTWQPHTSNTAHCYAKPMAMQILRMPHTQEPSPNALNFTNALQRGVWVTIITDLTNLHVTGAKCICVLGNGEYVLMYIHSNRGCAILMNKLNVNWNVEKLAAETCEIVCKNWI